MHIAHIIIGLNVGGAELMLKRLVEQATAAQTSRHSVVSLTALGPIGLELQQAGVQVDALGMKSMADLPFIFFKLLRYLKLSRPDVVQTWMYHADLIGGLAARFAGRRKIVWGIRTTDVGAGNKRSTVYVSRICAKLSRWVPDAIVCAATASRDSHVALGYDAGKMTVVPNGFDLDCLRSGLSARISLRTACDFADKTVVVGIVGRFNAAKDHQNFVMAAGLVARCHPEVRFLMVGRDLDPMNAELASWIAQTGYADRFILLGERSDVPACLAAMDVFCLSSRSEGFPNVVGEAMGAGLPCVVTDVGDAALLVGITGEVVPKEDPAALANGLEKLLMLAPSARIALGRQANKRISAEFTMDGARVKFETIYQHLLEI